MINQNLINAAQDEADRDEASDIEDVPHKWVEFDYYHDSVQFRNLNYVQELVDAHYRRSSQLVMAYYYRLLIRDDPEYRGKMAVHSKAHFKDILLIFFFFLAYGDSYKKIQDWTGLDDSTACTIFPW